MTNHIICRYTVVVLSQHHNMSTTSASQRPNEPPVTEDDPPTANSSVPGATTNTSTRKRPPSPPSNTEPGEEDRGLRRPRCDSANEEVEAVVASTKKDEPAVAHGSNKTDHNDGDHSTTSKQTNKNNNNNNEGDNNTNSKDTMTAPKIVLKETPPPSNPQSQEPSQKRAKKRNRTKRKHLDPALVELRTTVQMCCKRNDLATALQVYEAAVEAQTPMDRIIFDCLLNLCDGLLMNTSTNSTSTTQPIHVGTPRSRNRNPNSNASTNNNTNNEKDNSETVPPPPIRSVDDETRYQYASRLWQHMEQSLGQQPCSETAYTAMIRLTSRTHRFDEARTWLERAEHNTQQSSPKLRLYTPLLTAYCREHEQVVHNDNNDNNDNENYLLQAVRLWHHLSQKYQLQLTEKEYSTLLRSCVRGGDSSSAAFVVERILTDVAEIVPVPALVTTQTLQAWFESQHARHTNIEPSETVDTIRQLLHEIPSPYRPETPILGSVVHKHGWIISDSCPVEAHTGRLLAGCWQDEILPPVTIRPEACHDMQQLNENLVLTGQASTTDTRTVQGGRKGPKRPIPDPKERQRHWQAFQRYLEQRRQRHSGRTLDVVVDGANVGFYQTNFAGAPKHVDFRQIDSLIRHLVHNNYNNNKQSCSVLLVMHSRHFDRRHMPQWAHSIVQKWLKQDWLYRTPPGMNDDWFWLHAALTEQAMVVTNDEMRDHHFQMVAPQSFLRWRDRYQIHFTLGAWENNNTQRQVQLIHPERYSRRIHKMGNDAGFVVPLPKRGDENRFLDGAFVAGENDNVPEEETYLCIRKKEVAD